MERKVAWESYSDSQLEELDALSKRYIDFISDNKTERRCFAASVAQAQAAGYVSLEEGHQYIFLILFHFLSRYVASVLR